MNWKKLIATAGIIWTAGSLTMVQAQGVVDQEAVAPLLATQQTGVQTEAVTWHEYQFNSKDRTVKATLARLQQHLDSLPGEMRSHRLAVVEMSNRVRSKYMIQRSSLLIPDFFPNNFLAYAPYPARYGGAEALPKLLVLDKYTQTFGAYENGRLVRWGLISSGREDDLTPPGRYHFNWKQEYRESSEAPEGETWKMRWVFNFYAAKGIHVHQYQLPIAMPASHGCVRLSEADAAWNFNWAMAPANGSGGTPVIVINYNPAGMAAHWLSPSVSLVNLPDDPGALPEGGKNDAVAGW